MSINMNVDLRERDLVWWSWWIDIAAVDDDDNDDDDDDDDDVDFDDYQSLVCAWSRTIDATSIQHHLEHKIWNHQFI